jgi:hypothetical protein
MAPVRISEKFAVGRPPDEVIAFMAAPENLAKWQTIKTQVTPLTNGPTRLGSRFREGNKVGPFRWEQIVEVVEFDPTRVFAVAVVDGRESGGRWTFEPTDDGSRVRFEATFTPPPLVAPMLKRMLARQFRSYHENLRREVEAG